jgi:SAM-dependent methyltransferase
LATRCTPERLGSASTGCIDEFAFHQNPTLSWHAVRVGADGGGMMANETIPYFLTAEPERWRDLTIIWILLAVAGVMVVIHFAWRWSSRIWSLPCPTFLAWSLESPLFQRLSGTEKILRRIGFRPGQRILELGPGPGRLLLPAAQRVLPDGEAVGVDIQPGMIERLKARAQA